MSSRQHQYQNQNKKTHQSPIEHHCSSSSSSSNSSSGGYTSALTGRQRLTGEKENDSLGNDALGTTYSSRYEQLQLQKEEESNSEPFYWTLMSEAETIAYNNYVTSQGLSTIAIQTEMPWQEEDDENGDWDVFQEGDDLDPLDDSWEEHLYSEPFEPFNEDLLQSRYLNNTHPKDVCKFVCDDMTPSTERDSGLGRTEDGSLKQDEGSEQDVTDDCATPDSSTSSSSSQFADDFDSKLSPISATSHIRSPDCDVQPSSMRSFRDELELRCSVAEKCDQDVLVACNLLRNIAVSDRVGRQSRKSYDSFGSVQCQKLSDNCLGQRRHDVSSTVVNGPAEQRDPSKMVRSFSDSVSHCQQRLPDSQTSFELGQKLCNNAAELNQRPCRLSTFSSLQSQSPASSPSPTACNRVVPRMGTKVDSARFVSLPSSRPTLSPATLLSPSCQQPANVQIIAPVKLSSQSSRSEVNDTRISPPDLQKINKPGCVADRNIVTTLDALRLQTIPEVDSSTDVGCPSPMRRSLKKSNAKDSTRSASLSPRQLMMPSDHARQQQSLSDPQRSPHQPATPLDQSSDENSDNKLKEIYTKYVDTMLTNGANLAHTIALQQKLFLQQVNPTARSPVIVPSSYCISSAVPDDNAELPRESIASVDDDPNIVCGRYVVRRRSDGSRYIARKAGTAPPVARRRRKQLLEERARKLTDERKGMTTDDDAQSEIKAGRFWSKEERRAQLQRARQNKQRRQGTSCERPAQSSEVHHYATLPAKPSCGQQQAYLPSPVGDKTTEEVGGTMVQRKLSQLRPKALFDDFTTLQEILVHGVRDSGRSRLSNNGLLSVTTV